MPTSELPNLPRARRGPQPLAAADRRTNCVSVRLSAAELAELDAARAQVQMQRGEYLRAAGYGVLPPSIPAVNRRAWAELARTTANINQIAHRLNADGSVDLDEVRAAVTALRRALIGAEHFAENFAEDVGDEGQS